MSIVLKRIGFLTEMIEKGVFIAPVPLGLVGLWTTVLFWPNSIEFLGLTFTPWTILTIIALAFYVYKSIPSSMNLAPLVEAELTRLRQHSQPQHQPELSAAHLFPIAGPSAGIRPVSKDIKVLTYNLYLRPPFINSNGNDWKNERLHEFIKLLPEYDVVCLQEVFALGSRRQDKLVKAARQQGFHVVKCIPPPFLSLKFIDAGVLILSRFPVVECDGHIYTSGHQIDFYASKQVIYAKIEVSAARHVHVFTTHMQASYYENEEHINVKNDTIRYSQVQEMIDFARQKVGTDTESPIILSGDFNAPARDEPHDGTRSSRVYVEMMDLIRSTFSDHHVSDALHESVGEHPITYGDVLTDSVTGARRPRELVLTNAADYCCQLCIDYMIWLAPKQNNSSTGATGSAPVEPVQLVPGSTRVEPFFIDPTIGPYKFDQLSDHYGISSILRA